MKYPKPALALAILALAGLPEAGLAMAGAGLALAALSGMAGLRMPGLRVALLATRAARPAIRLVSRLLHDFIPSPVGRVVAGKHAACGRGS